MPGDIARTVGELRDASEQLATLATALAAVIAANDGGPLYRRLIAGLRSAIEAGSLRPGDLVPPETEIARHYRISRHTVRQAIGEMTRDGWFRRERGRGTFVKARPVAQSLGSFYYFADQMRERGLDFETRVLRRNLGRADASVALRLALPIGEPTVELTMLRFAEGVPLQIDEVVMPASISMALLTADLTHGSVYEVLAKEHHVRVTRGEEEIRPIVLDWDQARLLEVTVGSPAFQVDRRSTADDRPVELRRGVIRGDRYVFKADLPMSRELA